MKITFDRHLDGKGKPAVDIIFHPTSSDELDNLFRVEDILLALGLGFDTYYDYPAKQRGWQLDWSLTNELRTANRAALHRMERGTIRKHAKLRRKA